ncbi:MAG: polyprenyl diphosphate synthase [Minisyncoccia bacterium]
MNIQSIAYIIDGNRRWAVQNGLPKTAGHEYGVEKMMQTITWSQEMNIKHISFYIFSMENWKRSATEINAFMKLFEKMLTKHVDRILDAQAAIRFVGNISKIPKRLHKQMRQIEHDTKHFPTKVYFALSYGGKDEIVHAVRDASQTMTKKQLQTITEKQFEKFLWTSDIPDPELVIRTGGRKRLSNFFLWKTTYSELFFLNSMWPDFSRATLKRVIKKYTDKTQINKGV